MNNIITIIIFILSVVIAHIICSNYIYIGTFGGIFKEKLIVWFVTFIVLFGIAAGLHLVKLDSPSNDKESKQISEKDINEYYKEMKKQNDTKSEDSSEDLNDYDDSDLSDEDYSDDYDESYNDDLDSNKSDSSNRNEYILPDSASRELKKSDLKGLSKEELRIARNEIYARHGRRFNDKKLQEYFDSQSWYEGTIAADDFSEEVLNSFEKKNAAFIKQFE